MKHTSTKTTTTCKCLYCHTPLIEMDESIFPFYCSEECRHETSIALKEYFDELGTDLGTGG